MRDLGTPAKRDVVYRQFSDMPLLQLMRERAYQKWAAGRYITPEEDAAYEEIELEAMLHDVPRGDFSFWK